MVIERIDNFTRSNKLNKKLHEMIPGGSHTYSKGEDQFPSLSPKLIAKAEGAYCWDVDDNCFIDWAMGNRVMILGHGYPAVNNAVKKQMELGLNFSRPSILEYEVAEFLLDFWQWPEMVKFGKNGSDATTAAVKLSRAYTGRKYVAVCADHPFFSIHDWFIGTTSMDSGTLKEESEYTVKFNYNDLTSVEELFIKYPGQIASVILEPVKNEVPNDGFLKGLRIITEREGSVLIFDEMISGMKFDIRGAHHKYGIYPDLVTFGKSISNGFSFSALAGKRDIMELGGLSHNKPRVFLLSQTHSSETVGLAACRATIEECIRVDVSKHIWTLGKSFVESVRQIALEENVEKNVRIIGFDCNPQILCTHENGAYWPELHTSFHEEVISHGVLIPWITITYSHGEKEIKKTLDALRSAMSKLRRVLDSEVSVDSSYVGPSIKPVFRRFNRCMQSKCGRLHSDVTKLTCCDENLEGEKS